MRLVLFAALILAGTACDKNELVGCVNNTQCPEGNICDAGRCRTVCNSDDECSRGFICIENICERGVRNDAPSITGVVGNGSQSCTDSPDDRCFADAIVVQGEHLLGASFRLDNQGTGPSFTNLGIGSQNTDAQVELELPTDLAAGSYLLVAANAAGSDQVDVQILQGEPGPALSGQEMLTAINTEGTGMFLVARMPSSNELITHLNSGGTMKFSADLIPDGGGTAYDGDDIVGLVNSATATVYSERLGRDADDLIGRINEGSDPFDADLLPPANDILTYLNTANGSVVLGTHIAPGGGGGGSMTGPEIVIAINNSASLIDTDNLHTGTGSTDVALGNHTHPGTDITSDVPFNRLPTGTSADTVAIGSHTHSGAGSATFTASSTNNTTDVVDIPRSTIDPLCADADGCRVRIGLSRASLRGTVMPGISWKDDCPIHINHLAGSSNAWSVSYACAQVYRVYVGCDGDGALCTSNADCAGHGGSQICEVGEYYPLYSDAAGTDDDGTRGMVLVASSGGAWPCYFGDYGPGDMDDNQLGFHFWLDPSAAPSTFNDGSRACHIVIQD